MISDISVISSMLTHLLYVCMYVMYVCDVDAHTHTRLTDITALTLADSIGNVSSSLEMVNVNMNYISTKGRERLLTLAPTVAYQTQRTEDTHRGTLKRNLSIDYKSVRDVCVCVH